MSHSCVFATKTWKKDWQQLLSYGLQNKIDSCDYKFDKTMLMVNNGVPKEMAEAFFMTVDETVDVGEKAQEVMDFFELSRDDFKNEGGDGYVYAIAELTAIYMAKDFDYLCYVQGDAIISPPKDWVTPAIKILEEYSKVAVVSPKSEVNTWHDQYGLDHYCSDQAMLVRVSEFRQPIYKYDFDIKDYPDYGGNSFEHMVGKYLKQTKRYRKILDKYWILHPAF